jgi:hypothetical protein
MTLKEKIADEYIWTTEPIVDIEEVNNSINKMEQISDDYAIDFAEWIRKEVYYEHLTKEFIYKRNVYESEKELLEIYKKEKRL